MPPPTRHPNPLWQPPPTQYPPLDAQGTGATDYPDYARYRPDQDWGPGEYYPEQVCFLASILLVSSISEILSSSPHMTTRMEIILT